MPLFNPTKCNIIKHIKNITLVSPDSIDLAQTARYWPSRVITRKWLLQFGQNLLDVAYHINKQLSLIDRKNLTLINISLGCVKTASAAVNFHYLVGIMVAHKVFQSEIYVGVYGRVLSSAEYRVPCP